MKSAPLFLTIAAIAFSASAHARPEKTQPETVVTEKVTRYQLKNRSAFNTGDDARIPFWPIGFQRPVKGGTAVAAPNVVPPKIQLEPRHFNVTSILLGNPALATINGRAFAEGELLPVMSGNERLRVVVRRIHDGIVTLGYESVEIHVPMRRAELGAKQAQAQARPSEFTIQIGSPAAK